MEVLTLEGVKTIPFSYPYDRSEETISLDIDHNYMFPELERF